MSEMSNIAGALQKRRNWWREVQTGWKSGSRLLWQMASRQIAEEYKGSSLGLLWAVLNPLIMLGIYTFVFGVLMKGRFGVIENETGLQFSLGVFFGLTLFGLVSTALNASPATILGNRNLVKKVRFPLEVLPAAMVLAALFRFGVSLGLAFVGVLLLGPAPSVEMLWFPAVILPLFPLCFGLAWLLAALGVYFRDIGQIIQFFSTALFYGSGIFYSAELVQKTAPLAWDILRFNPVFLLIDEARRVVLWAQPPDWMALVYCYGLSILMALLGWWVFRRLKSGFADVV